MRKVTVYHYDAFSNVPYKGNPAGVVVEADSFSDKEMQSIAYSVGFNETVFVMKSNKADLGLRYFTPGHEINLCGHATIASLFCLKTRGFLGDRKSVNIVLNSSLNKAKKWIGMEGYSWGGFMEASYFLRHFLAGLKYRCVKAISNSHDDYSNYEVGNGVRTPHEILFHITHVLRCAQSVFDNNIELDHKLKSWNEEVEQFYIELDKLDKYISEGIPDRERIVEKLLQGPLSDAMTHVGQLSMLRRISGEPIHGESFFDANIRIDR